MLGLHVAGRGGKVRVDLSKQTQEESIKKKSGTASCKPSRKLANILLPSPAVQMTKQVSISCYSRREAADMSASAALRKETLRAQSTF